MEECDPAVTSAPDGKAARAVGIVAGAEDPVQEVGAGYFPLQVPVGGNTISVYLPPSPSKLARASRPVLLAPRPLGFDAAKHNEGPEAVVDALQFQGAGTIIALHCVESARVTSFANDPAARGGPNVWVPTELNEGHVNTDSTSKALRRRVEEVLLMQGCGNASTQVKPSTSYAFQECVAATRAGLEFCAVFYIATADERVAAESWLLDRLITHFRDSPPDTAGMNGNVSAGLSTTATTDMNGNGPDSIRSTRVSTDAGPDPFAEPTKKVVDLVIKSRWVLPIEPDETEVLSHHAVVINDGLIDAIVPSGDVDALYAPRVLLERPDHVTMPGLINTHAHTGMSLMRGKADDEPLQKWLHETVWPIEMAFRTTDGFCEDGALLAAAEMTKSGVTTFADMYWYPEKGASALLQSGIRAMLGMIVIGFPSDYANTPDDYLARGHAAMEKYANEKLLSFAYTPHAPYTVPDDVWKKIQLLSKERNILVHTHIHETSDECTASVALDRSNPSCHLSENACRPLENLDRMNLLNNKLVAAHMVHLTDEEIEKCASKGVSVAHCPNSNAKLASGFCPVTKLLKAGVNVALGTDSAASNNSLDIFGEMKMAALLAKNVSGDPTAVPAATALRMGTINGARALGLDDVTGSLKPGKAADLICVAMSTHAYNAPVFDVCSALVYAASRHDVTDAFVAGRQVLRDRNLQMLDEEDIVRRAKSWAFRIDEKFPPKKGSGTSDIFPPKLSAEDAFQQGGDDVFE